MLHVDLVDEYDDVLDNHAQQPQPAGNREEPEIESRKQQADGDADQRQRQHAEDDDRFAEITEQRHEDNNEHQERQREVLHQSLHRLVLILELRIPEKGIAGR